jgi:hypothetical protein
LLQQAFRPFNEVFDWHFILLSFFAERANHRRL